MRATKRFLTTATISGILILGLFSCKKDEETPDTGQVGSSSETKVSEYLNSREKSAETFTITTTSTQSVTTAEGTQVTIPANAFTDLNGNPVSGEVTFKVTDIYKKSDMIKSQKPTISDGQVLISGGEFNFSAQTSTGETLKLDEGVYISVQTPVSSEDADNDMQLFIGEEDENGDFNWDEAFGDSLSTANRSYFFNIDSLTWINIDKFYDATNTTLTINLSDGAVTNKAVTYVVFHNINSVIIVSETKSTDKNTYETTIPLGESVTVISLAEVDNKLQKGQSSSFTTTENGSVDISFEELSESEIDDFFESFD